VSAGDPALGERAAALASRTYELTEFLVDVLSVVDVGAYFPHRVTYHRPVTRCGCCGWVTGRPGCCGLWTRTLAVIILD
jgi:hypothetical protein